MLRYHLPEFLDVFEFGTGLSFSIICYFSSQVIIPVQPRDFNDVGIGWLFAPIIGVWGLASMALGITHSSLSKKTALPFACFHSNLDRFRLPFMNYDGLWRELVLEILFWLPSFFHA